MRWSKNKLIALKLRNGKYSLIQLLERKGYIIVYNLFQNTPIFENIILSKELILFKTFVIHKEFLRLSEIEVVKSITPLSVVYPSFPSKLINRGSGFRKIKLWQHTENEVEIGFTGIGNNLLANVIEPGNTEYSSIKIEEYELYKEYELESLRSYPELNERILLCSELGYNFDPVKELAFNRELDIICKTYIDIISQKKKVDFYY
ncbi:hypothetical protein [Aureivirga sp. CE67]|uniref:hypothetical protein n=1 Tax=Aureivirga sp. CE67 TaxID=1788983 RepID=UPI0018CB8ED1|nr:hypothetical protein [Aureivirga sp. CE67]